MTVMASGIVQSCSMVEETSSKPKPFCSFIADDDDLLLMFSP